MVADAGSRVRVLGARVVSSRTCAAVVAPMFWWLSSFANMISAAQLLQTKMSGCACTDEELRPGTVQRARTGMADALGFT